MKKIAFGRGQAWTPVGSISVPDPQAILSSVIVVVPGQSCVLQLNPAQVHRDGRLLHHYLGHDPIRPVALRRKNSLFAGSKGGAQHWAINASLIEIAKFNGFEPTLGCATRSPEW